MKFNLSKYFIQNDIKLVFFSIAIWVASYWLCYKIVRSPEMPFWPFWLSLLACISRPGILLDPLAEDKRPMLIKWLTTNDRVFYKGKTGYLKVEDAERLLDEVIDAKSGSRMSFIQRHVFYCLVFNLFAFLLALSMGYSAVIEACDKHFRSTSEKIFPINNPYSRLNDCIYKHKDQLFNFEDDDDY